METKIKFIIIGLIGFCLICLFIFMQAASQQQRLLRENNDLKTENTVLVSKASKLENDLRETQGKISSLSAERDRGMEEVNELQKKFESVSRVRDELIGKLKKNSQSQVSVRAPQPVQPQAVVSQNADAYWGTVLKAKADLEMQLSGIQAELRNLQAGNETLQREKSILEVDINSLRNDKKDLLRQLDYNQKLLDSMSQEVVRERNDKVAIQDNLKTIREQSSILSRQLKSLISRKNILDKKVQNLQEGKSAAEKRLNEMEEMLTDRISKIDALKDELYAVRNNRALDIDKELKDSKEFNDPVELPEIVVHSASSAERGKAQLQEFSGKILAINLESNFVVIDLGSSSGVKIGDVFNVYRQAKSIGAIGVIQIRAGISACDIKKMNIPFKTGDYVK